VLKEILEEFEGSNFEDESGRGYGHLNMLTVETEDIAEDEAVDIVSVFAEDDGRVAELSVFITEMEEVEISF